MSFSPVLGNPKPQYEDETTGIPSVNWTLTFSEAGTSTPLDTYTDSSGATANDNPLTLNSRGEPENAIGGATMIYGDTLIPYKVILKDSAGATVWTIDDVYPGSPVDDWVSGTAATRASATTFTVSGIDVTSLFHENRRVKCTGGADVYGTITDSTFVTDTTVTVLVDAGGTLNAGMDTAYVGVNSADSTSSAVNYYPEVSGETGVTNLTYPVGNVLRYGADPTYTVDAGLAINNCITSLPSISGTLAANTPAMGTIVNLTIPEGRYKISTTIANRSYVKTVGDNAVLDGDAGVTVMTTPGYGASFHNLRFADGAVALAIDTNNVDTSIINIEECEFLHQTTASITATSDSDSTILNIEGSKFSNLENAAYILDLDSLNVVNIINSWFTSDCQYAFKFGDTVAGKSASVSMRGCLCIPHDYMRDNGAWIRMEGGSFKSVDTIFSGENGGATIMEYRVPTDKTVATATNESVQFSGGAMTTTATLYSIKFYEVPFSFKINDVKGFQNNLGFWFDTAMSAASIKNADKNGYMSFVIEDMFHTSVDRIGGQSEAATKAYLGNITHETTYHLDDSDYVLRIHATNGGFGSSFSSANVTVDTATYISLYGQQNVSITGSSASDDGTVTRLWTTAMNGLAAGFYTICCELDNVSDEMVSCTMIGSEKSKTFTLTPGRNIIAMPFYFTAAYNERVGLTLSKVKNGVELRYAEFRIIKGNISIETANTITYASTTPAPPAGGVIGDYSNMTAPVEAGIAPDKYIIKGWRRLTTGAGNVLNTDWFEERVLTGN